MAALWANCLSCHIWICGLDRIAISARPKSSSQSGGNSGKAGESLLIPRRRGPQRTSGKIVVWWRHLSSKRGAAFNNAPLVFLIDEPLRDSPGESWALQSERIPLKIGLCINSAWRASISECLMIFFFFFNSPFNYVIPDPFFFFPFLSNPVKSVHRQWINEDALYSLWHSPDVESFLYRIAQLLG